MRKIKLMALLLAALMVVTAFAGCAGVKQEDLDAVNDRVDELENAINGVGDKIDALPGTDNSAVLEAIENMKEELEQKIDAVNGRVDDVVSGTTPPAGDETTAAATKAAQDKAIASIEVKKALFAKDAAEYDDATYEKIVAALGTAMSSVNAATTEAAVKSAMDALEAELGDYMTYAAKLYVYYTQLLGNVNDDAEALVEEVLDYIAVIDEVYDDLDKDVKVEMRYLVSEGTTAARNVYLDVYTSVKTLCKLYSAKTITAGDDTFVEYVDENGKVVEVDPLMTLTGFKAEAKKLVEDIKKAFKDGITFEVIVDKFDTDGDLEKLEALEALQDRYETYVENATVVGGEALVALIENADLIAEAWDEVANLVDAYDAFETLVKVKNRVYEDGFYNYTQLAEKVSLTFVDAKGNTVVTEEYYAEIDDVIADWAEEYALSAEDVVAIIEEHGYDYDEYLLNRRTVALVAAAYEKFADEIVPVINDLNKLTSTDAQAAESYDEVVEAVRALFVLQEGDAKAKNDLDKKDIYLTKAVFTQFLEESAVLDMSNLVIDREGTIKALDSDKVAKLNESRINNFAAYITDATATKPMSIDDANFVQLFTFASDVADLKETETADEKYLVLGTDGAITAINNDDGEIYNFFANDYVNAKAEAKKINDIIKSLAKQVKENKLDSNQKFIDLAGEYISVANDAVPSTFEKETDDEEKTITKDDSAYYVAITDVFEDYADATAAVKVLVEGATPVMTIDYFNYAFEEFQGIIDVETFNEAKATLDARLEKLFTDVDDIKVALDKVDYVRDGYVFVDENGDGKYVAEDGDVAGAAITQLVSLNDKPAVDAAIAVYDAWVKAGGNEGLKIFAEVINPETEEAFGGAWIMKGFDADDDVAATLEVLGTLESQIKTLVDAADLFVKAVKAVENVNTYNPILVDYMTLSGYATSANRYAVTKFVQSSASNAIAGVHGAWQGIKENNKFNTTTQDLIVSNESYTRDTVGDYLESVAILTKLELLKDVAEAYEAFVAANIEYTPATNNDYEDDAKTNYYVAEDYAEYKAVEDAFVTYGKYELISAQAAVVDAFAGINGNEWEETTVRQVKAATSLTEIENILVQFNIKSDTDISAAALTPYTVYEFARLGLAA